MQNLSGQAIRGYELRELIGIGGFAAVYRAYQPAVERDVAIKVILAKYANNPNFVRRFEAEAQLIARLEHIHIVPLYDYWREPNNAYLVMRWLRGGSLFGSVQQGGPWKLRAAARLIDQIASALAIAHRNNIIHRDLTPANILLDEEQNAYLADFGIAKDAVVEEEGGDKQLYGSPAYMSPEQIKGEETTPQTDIYSLGIMIYEMLTGRTPFTASSIANLMHMHLADPVPPLQAFRPDLPYAFNVVIMTAVAKNPKVRYPDVLSLAADFRQALQSVEDDRESVFDTIRAEAVVTTNLRPETLVLGSETQILEAPPPQNPYKGLRAFDEADSLDFFGRTALVEQLLKPLREPSWRFLAVVGPSGSGKSSVVKAGLLPALRRNTILGSENWFVAKMVPGVQPLQELESALLSVTFDSSPELFQQLRSSERGLLDIVGRILPGDDTPLLLLIDQFEEVFTRVTDEAERALFLNSLFVAATDPESRLRIIITLRADFYDRPLLYSGFGDLIREGTQVVLPLTADELQDAIISPAHRADLTLEPGLVAAIIADVNEQPGALPLLQFALTELFERRTDRTLTLQAYRESGSVLGALARRAEEVTSKMPEDQQEVTQQLFLRLVNLGEGTEDTRRRVRWAELVSVGVNKKEVTQRILELFGQYRLLTFDRDPQTREPTVEIAHEALIREWQRLRGWLQENRDDLRVQQRLVLSTAEWIKAGRDSSYLATGNRLAQFETLMNSGSLALTEDELAYVRASVKLRQRGVRRLRMFVTALVIFSIISLILAGFAFDRQRRAETAQATTVAERDRADLQARISRSGELAVTALNRISEIDLALLLSLEALHSADTFEARNSLVRTLVSNPRLSAFLHDSSSEVRSVAFSPDGQWLAEGNSSGEVILWDVAARRVADRAFEGHTDDINSVAFSPDGTILASASKDGTIRLWDVASGASLGDPLDGHDGNPVWSVAFSPDGTRLASGGEDIMIRLWDVASQEPLGEPLSSPDYVWSLAFSPNGRLLASGCADMTIQLWDVETGEAVGEPLSGHSDPVWNVAFSPDGRLLASASGGLNADNTIRLWDVNTRESVVQPLEGHTEGVRSLAFSPDGLLLVSGSEDDTVRLWDVETGFPVGEPLISHSNKVWSVAFNPDGHTLASGSWDHSIILWDLQTQPLIQRIFAGNQEEVLSLAFSPDGQILASGGGSQSGGVDNSVRLWNVQTGAQLALFAEHSAPVTAAVFSPDGQILASASADITINLWNVETGQMEGEPLTGHTDAIRTAAFSPDGRWLASAGDDRQIIFWDITTGERSGDLIVAQDNVYTVAFSPDGQILASGDASGTVTLWDTATRRSFGEPLVGHRDVVTSLAFSPDGQILASGSRDYTIILWDMRTSPPTGQTLTGHTNYVNSISFSPDGRTLASGSRDNTVILWDVATRQQLGLPFSQQTWVTSVAFNPISGTLASGARDTSVILWKMDVNSWSEAACGRANRNLSPAEWTRYFGDEPYRETCVFSD